MARKQHENYYELDMPPAKSEEEQITRCGALAYVRAEEQLRNGTATPAMIIHFLKLNSENSRLEREKLRCEVELIKAKTDLVNQTKNTEAEYAEAVAAMKRYGGSYNNNEPVDL